MSALPKFEVPPVMETVLSIQFAPLSNFTGALAGWFWKSYLDGKMWTHAVDAVPVPDAFEQFGPDTGWVSGMTLQSTNATRTQIISADDERMIQIQGSRFILNWKKVKGDYPSYDKLYPEFVALFGRFKEFAKDAGCEAIQPNQWEITYVNHFDIGDLWGELSDYRNIFRNDIIPLGVAPVGHPDTINASWRYVIEKNEGRLHVQLNHARLPPENKEILRLQLAARGPTKSGDDADIKRCFDLGHESIVRTFSDITSERAHQRWRRMQ